MTELRRHVRVRRILGVVAFLALAAVGPSGCRAAESARSPKPRELVVAFGTPGVKLVSSEVSMVADGNAVYNVVVEAPAGRVDPRDGFRALAAAMERQPKAWVHVVVQVPRDELAGAFYSLERSPEGALTVEAGDSPVAGGQVGPDGAVPARAYTKLSASEVGTFTPEAISAFADGTRPVPKRVAEYWAF